jgi:Peptidase_C39 like family
MPRQIRYDAWSRVVPRPGADLSSTWVSPWCEVGFEFDDLVASWAATTPRGSWLEVSAQARGTRGWHSLGSWSSGPRPPHRSSPAGDPEVDTDVWHPTGGASAYRLRVALHGPAGVHRIGAVVSAGRPRTTPSSPLRRGGRVLDVPRLSQMTYADEGGRGWCSPTSVAMVLSHAGTLPSGTDIPAAAREVFDPAYDGTGNWSFNTAWAAGLAGRAFVTRLHDLRDVERLVDAGIPVVASVAYPDGALSGAPTRGTDGHLLVIRGFTATGDVVTNDPAAPTERSVRRTYDRGQLERAWLDGSGGAVYVVHRDDQPLPPGSRGAW